MAKEIELVAVVGAMVLGIIMISNNAYQKSSPRNGFALLVSSGVWMNCHYGICDIREPISFFIGIYDPLTNLGVGNGTEFQGLTTCSDGNNGCTVLSEYEYHQGWASDYYDRMVLGPVVRRAKLYAHIYCNTGALAIGFFQFQGTFRKRYPTAHRYMGWVATVLVLAGVAHALVLASEHGDVVSYGGNWAILGWWTMAATTVTPLILGVRAAMQKDFETHQKWMTRWYGAMFGSFLVFRVIFLVVGPFFRSLHPAALTLFAVYVSAPLGVAIAEWSRFRYLVTGKQRTS